MLPARPRRQRPATKRSPRCSTPTASTAKQHEQIRADLREGRIGLAQNRLPANAVIEDVRAERCHRSSPSTDPAARRARPRRPAQRRSRRRHARRRRRLALDAGRGRGQGAAPLRQTRRTPSHFPRDAPRQVPPHLAPGRHAARRTSSPPATSPTSRSPRFSPSTRDYGYEGPLLLSPGTSVGLRMVPTERDLRFAWEEMPQQMLDEQQQKVRDSLRAALIGWARSAGRSQRLHRQPPAPVPASRRPLVRSAESPPQRHRSPSCSPSARSSSTCSCTTSTPSAPMLDPALLGRHIESGAALSFEVITRRLEDRGGGLARVNGRPRLVEGLAMPREEAEFALTYYNTLTTWIDLDRLLDAFGLTRDDFAPGRDSAEKITAGIRGLRRQNAHLHHAQRREEALGPRPGRHLPRHAIRKALGRHDRPRRRSTPASSSSRAAAASSSKTKPSSTAGCATAPPPSSNRSAPGASPTRHQEISAGPRQENSPKTPKSSAFNVSSEVIPALL